MTLDGGGRVTSTTAPSGEVTTYAYDGFLPKSITWSGPVAGSVALSYNPDFQVASESINGGAPIGFGYDADALLTCAGAASCPAAGALSLSRDAHNGLLAGTALGNVSDVAVSQYGYDGDDNRTTVGVEAQTHPTYDAQDGLVTYPSLGATYAYTANGELATKTVGSEVTSYSYDVLGNLLHVGFSSALPDGTTSIDYVVDGQNRRVGRKVNGTLMQAWLYRDERRPVAQLDGAGNLVATFVYGANANVPDLMVTSGGAYRITKDHLGSPRLVADARTGAAVEAIEYDEFGNETDTFATPAPSGYVRVPFGFAGGLFDPETTLVRFGARDYDASVGRWTGKDPLRFGGESINVYSYVGNDPVNASDPSGQLPTGCDFACNAAATLACLRQCPAAGPYVAACAIACSTVGLIACDQVCHPGPPPPGPKNGPVCGPPPGCDMWSQSCPQDRTPYYPQ